MCGRYANARRRQDLLDAFFIERDTTPEELPPDYNVAPTKPVYTVMERSRDDTVTRELHVARWGLVPSWAKDPGIGSRLINARVETVAEKPAFRRAFARRRCLLPADGYYEWYAQEDGAKNASGKPRKQPFYIHPGDDGMLAFAGLYELWKDPSREGDDAWLWSCTIITTDAPDDLGRIHDRMPMVIPADRWDAWLDYRSTDPDELRDLLAPAMAAGDGASHLVAYPVSTEVNNVRNNGPELREPLPAEGADGAGAEGGDAPGDPTATLF
jgi:putative SOS response-associated peptidase YedK